MNRPSPASDDDRRPTGADAPTELQAFHVTLIDLTTSQLVITIGEPTDGPAATGPSRLSPSTAPHPIPSGHCAGGRVRPRMTCSRARHFGPESGCQ